MTKQEALYSDDPFIEKEGYRRTCKIHIKSLMQAVKNREDLVLYTLYVNLKSLYKNSCINNYEERYAELSKETSLSIRELKKYIPKLIEENIALNYGKNLQIGNAHKMMIYLGVAWDYLGLDGLDKFNWYHSKRIIIKRRKTFTRFELQSLSLELLQKRKRRGFVLKANGNRRGLQRNYRKLGRIEMQSRLEKKCAEDPTTDIYLRLCLTEIAAHFGLKTKQGASRRMSLLEGKKLIKTTQVYKALGKVDAIQKEKELSNHHFKKDGWLIKQMPNNLKFLKPFTGSVWWDTTISEYFERVEKIKAEKRKSRKEQKGVIEFSNTLTHYLSQPIVYGKKIFKETFIDRLTGELVHTSIYFVFRDLTVEGKKYFSHYVTKFKKLDLKSYTKIKEQIFDFSGLKTA